MSVPKYRIFNRDCIHWLQEQIGGPEQLEKNLDSYDTVFMDPPDNIKLGYDKWKDNMPSRDYVGFLTALVFYGCLLGKHLWVSFNPKWTVEMGVVAQGTLEVFEEHFPDRKIEIRPCVQTFTFGQNNNHDLGVGHRPLWRFSMSDQLFPEAIKVPSWRELNGDKRAKPGGRVPLDVFDFPRVTGNSKQRRKWHPTQLHEGLVERCLRLTTPPGGTVLDPFAGTGTTLRVSRKCGFNCDTIEVSRDYCEKILFDQQLPAECLI